MKALIFNILMFFTHIEEVHKDVAVSSAKDAIVHTSKDAIEIELPVPDVLDRMYIDPLQVLPKPIRPPTVTRVNP